MIGMNRFLVVLIFFVQCSPEEKQVVEKTDWPDVAIEKVLAHYKNACEQYTDLTKIPRSTNPDGSIHARIPKDWTSGFFPGTLWQLYDYSQDEYMKEMAEKWNSVLHEQPFDKGTHDVGFKVNCSFGQGFRLTGNKDYKKAVIQGAESLITRFNETVGCTKSWDWSKKWKFPVIIDNMMNLEILYETTKLTGDARFADIADIHANTTLENHFRDDNSSFHVVDFNAETGDVLSKNTHQGYSDESAWARGQAWGLYGFTLCYRYTKNPNHLQQAEKIAEFFLNHPNLPDDFVPYWDFNALDIPNAPRDASAAAIVASALIELSEYSDKGGELFSMAESMLKSLSSDGYLAEAETNNNFALMHCTGNHPGNSEIDVPLNYADYYFVEALLRYKEKL
jgi:hypothetical protein